MSTLGAQEAIVTAAPGEWELIGRDMIRTKRTAWPRPPQMPVSRYPLSADQGSSPLC